MQHIDIRRRAVWDAHAALRTHLSATPLPSVQKAVREVLREGRAAAAAAVHQQRQEQLASLSSQDASAGGVTLGVPAEAFRADSSSGGASPLQEDFIVVTRDRNGTVEMPTFALDHGLVHVTASSAFTSVLYRSVLASGRWCYEVTLGTEGLVQIGWCPPQDLQQWNTKLGVGDFMHSLGFDGSRDRVWHGQGRELVKGAAWMEGDIVTCCVDLDASVVTYYLNGRLAWSGNVHTLSSCRADLDEEAAPYYVMCAGVSSAAAERYTLNVGHSPLAFPPPGYTPLASLPYMTAAAAQGVLSTSIPPYLDAHVIAEAACAITHILEPALAADESATILTRKRRNLALAALVDEMPPATLDCLGAALCAAFLRSAATAETNSPSSLPAHHDDTPMKTTASDIVVALGAFLPSTCTPDLFRSVLSFLSYIARGVTFPVPSRAEQNRYSRAAMRLVVHLVQNHYELMCEAWPPADDPVQFDHAVAPFYRAKAPSRAVRDELIADVDLTAPLKDVRLRDAAAALGDDLYTQLMPYAEALFSTLYSHRPVAVTEFATRVGERHENAGSSGVMLWTVLARVILSRTASLTTEQVVEEWCNRRKLLSERGATVEGRRLGGSPSAVLRRCSVGHPRVPATDASGDPLLIVVSWLFHYCARRQFPAILNDLASLRQHAQILARGDGDTADATLKVNTLVRVALVQRSRMANKGFIDTLFGFNDLLFRIMDHFANKAMLVTLPTPSSSEPAPTAVPDMLAAGVTFRKVTPTEPVVDFMLIPQGFVATTAVILQLTRRAMPTAYSAWLASAPHAFRFSIIAALSPVVDQSENAVEGILHLATLLLESPYPDPIPHSRTVAQTVTSDYVAYFVSKCFLQMSNDFSWSMAVNALSCLNTGNSLLQPRSTDPLSDGWLSWEDQVDHSEQHVPPTPRSSAFGLFRDAVRLLNSAERVKAMKRAKSIEWRHDESCDLEKAFKTIVNRTSWLISEMEVGAQDEVSGSSRGTVETRRRLGIVFELLQRNIAIIEFLIDAAGDQLVADSDATDSAGAAVPLIVQTFVEMLMLLMRDYGRPESVMNQLVKLNFPELTQIHPWRVVGPLTGILITLLTPAARDGMFEGWQLVFHKMLKSPRCSWDVSTLLHAVSTLNIEELVEKRLAFTVEFKLQRLRAEEWKPLLMSLAEANRASPKKSNNGLTPPMGASPPQNANSPAVGAANALADVSTSDEDDDALCTICCVDEVNVTFVPCGHRSCRPCIERQLQGNQKTCFFCKTPVTSLTECTGTDAPSYPMPPRQPTLPRVIGTPTTPHTGFPLFPEIP